MTYRRWYRSMVLCIISATLVLTSCALLAIPSRRDPPVALRELLIDESALPAGWRAGEVSSIPRGASDDHGDETLMIGFIGPSTLQGHDGAYHLIYRFRNSALAAQVYKTMQNDILFFREAADSGKHPADWQYRSPIADDWRFACEFRGCGAIARYDEFVSVFSASMTTSSMAPAALEAALKAIDQRMAEKLNKTPATAPRGDGK